MRKSKNDNNLDGSLKKRDTQRDIKMEGVLVLSVGWYLCFSLLSTKRITYSNLCLVFLGLLELTNECHITRNILILYCLSFIECYYKPSLFLLFFVQVLVNDNALDLINEAVGGANVGNAHHPCQGQPCLNNGECHPLHENYLCDCRLGFKGDNCEIGQYCKGYVYISFLSILNALNWLNLETSLFIRSLEI